MLVVIADDFSGAAEIGGIGWRYGLSSEVQPEFNPETNADLVVIDADTRSLSKQKAIEKTESLAKQLKNCGRPIALFKKVDSVLRGHIVAEINSLQRVFLYQRVLLHPANPRRGRKIISGDYFVNDISLDKTVFANDPHFPASTSSVEQIIGNESVLPHIHLKKNNALPATGLITGDVSSKEDLKNYIRQTNENDLCCGAAECFETYLENKGYVEIQSAADHEIKFLWPSYTIIISGSTVKDQFEKDTISEHHFPSISVPGRWDEEKFILEEDEEENWLADVLNMLQQHKLVALSINQEVKKSNTAAAIFSGCFKKLVNFISGKLGGQNVHFAITGGATASDIIKKPGLCLKVKKEIAPGIVTLVNEHSGELFTVKPGSYLWPALFINSLFGKK